MAYTHFANQRYTEAVDNLRKTIKANSRFAIAYALWIASLMELGLIEEARSVAERLKALEPSFRIGSFVSLGTVYRAHRETIEAALREAGLPE